MKFKYSAFTENNIKQWNNRSNKHIWTEYEGGRLMCISCKRILRKEYFMRKSRIKRGYSCQCKFCSGHIKSIDDISGELWVDMLGFEEFYQVSNMGRIKSKIRIIKNCNSTMVNTERILKQAKNSNGYLCVRIQANKIKKSFMVHRLVAQHFIPNNNPLFNCVNHIDENKQNNKADNLEWCDHLYNNNHGTRNKRISEANSGKVRGTMLGISKSLKELVKKGAFGAIPVIRINIDTGETYAYNSISQAAKHNNIYKTQIARHLKNLSKNDISGYIYIKPELQEYFKSR